MLFRLSLVESTFMSQSKEVQMFSIQDFINILIFFLASLKDCILEFQFVLNDENSKTGSLKITHLIL